MTKFDLGEVKKAGYLFPCPTKGRCARIAFEEVDWEWDDSYPSFGNFNIRDEEGKSLFYFKCCTNCHKPLNQEQATKVNAFLGNTLEELKIDDDFLELLNGL